VHYYASGKGNVPVYYYYGDEHSVSIPSWDILEKYNILKKKWSQK
jgi:hypothetical protein